MYPELHQLASLVAAQAPAGGCGGGQEQLLLPILMFAILYFVWLRPAANEQKKQAEMLEKLKRGDKILTKSGLVGVVADKTEKMVTLEIARNVKVEMLKSSIAGKFSAPEEAKDAGAKKESGSAEAKTSSKKKN